MNTKAYPTAWAHADALRAGASRWQRRGLLTAAQQAAIETVHPVAYYRPNNWIRVLLFGSTLLGGLTTLGFLGVITDFKLGPVAYGVLTMLAAGVALELLIKNSHHYRSGVDNALLYGALGAWAFLIFYTYFELLPTQSVTATLAGPHGSLLPWLLALVVLLASLVVALMRYADPLVAVAAFGTALLLLVSALFVLSWLLPLALMGAAAGLLLWLRKLPTRADYFYYRSAGLVVRTLAIAVFYLAGNYLIVREGNTELLGGGSLSQQIPLAPLFYALTAGIPLLYIVLGLRRHDRLLLKMGLLALAFSIYTLRYYRTLMPPEIAATIGGAVLLLGSLAALRYLRTPRHGLIAAANTEAVPRFNLESMIIAETAHIPAAPEVGFQFGGGESGGGGAEGRF
jgi:hypothetical protein